MAAVDMQQVDRAVPKIGQSIVKSTSNQARETGIIPIIEGRQRRENLLSVKAGVLVADPGVDRVTGGL